MKMRKQKSRRSSSFSVEGECEEDESLDDDEVPRPQAVGGMDGWRKGGYGGGGGGGMPGAAPSAPPPPPVEHVWHIAVNGETTGPFSKATLGQMAAKGEMTRDTWIWTQGQDGWQKAEDVSELAQLFTVMPPPPPAG